jgi:hypothetical protein
MRPLSAQRIVPPARQLHTVLQRPTPPSPLLPDRPRPPQSALPPGNQRSFRRAHQRGRPAPHRAVSPAGSPRGNPVVSHPRTHRQSRPRIDTSQQVIQRVIRRASRPRNPPTAQLVPLPNPPIRRQSQPDNPRGNHLRSPPRYLLLCQASRSRRLLLLP